MAANSLDDRVFLFLQGPHGPFFSRLGKLLTQAGAAVWRVGFNAGDQFFWSPRERYIPYRGTPQAWPDRLQEIMLDKGVTDLVIYGDTRPIHAQAVKLAKKRGITVHVFEEGYMRPYWVTYERDGSNGNSRLMHTGVEHMQKALAQSDIDAPLPPGHWGDMREHIFYGALYHWFVMFVNFRYREFQPHRAVPVSHEFRLYLKRLLLMPLLWCDRLQATWRVRRGGFPYHMVLLQLEHDSAFQMHSPFKTTRAFLDLVMTGFAKGAPKHHHLVIKTHPLEDGRSPLRRDVAKIANQLGIVKRVHFVRGGKLAQLLNDARTAVTVNSTAGHQVLWRGIPIKTFGKAIYAKPELVSDQSLSEFFSTPRRPNSKSYLDFRRYLLETSQVPGGFYSAASRRQLLRHLVDLMLATDDPYVAFEKGTAAPRQQLRAVN
ncbi:MAG: capsule biosynthesis protein CapA [Pseudomonadota bacterium]